MFCNANLRSDGQPVGELSMGQQPVESSSSLPVFFQRKTKMLHTHMFHTFLGMIGLLGLAGVRLVWASLRCQDRRCSVVFPRRTEDLCSVGKQVGNPWPPRSPWPPWRYPFLHELWCWLPTVGSWTSAGMFYFHLPSGNETWQLESTINAVFRGKIKHK